MTRRSRLRNSASPSRANISAMLHPASRSISASASRNGSLSRAAKRRPTLVLPTPIMPTSAMLRPASGAERLSMGRTWPFNACLNAVE